MNLQASEDFIIKKGYKFIKLNIFSAIEIDKSIISRLYEQKTMVFRR